MNFDLWTIAHRRPAGPDLGQRGHDGRRRAADLPGRGQAVRAGAADPHRRRRDHGQHPADRHDQPRRHLRHSLRRRHQDRTVPALHLHRHRRDDRLRPAAGEPAHGADRRGRPVWHLRRPAGGAGAGLHASTRPPPSASSARWTAQPRSTSPASSRRICWRPSPWPPTAT